MGSGRLIIHTSYSTNSLFHSCNYQLKKFLNIIHLFFI